MTDFTSLRLSHGELERHTTWLEIFFDLTFAVIVTQLSTRLFDHVNYLRTLQCIALFIPSFWAWASYTVFAARFDKNDSLHWIMTFVIMFAAAVMAVQIPTALETGANGFTIGFLISQISLLFLYSRTIFDDKTPRNLIALYLIGFGLGTICWAISLYFNPPIKFFLWILGMSIYLVIPWIGRKRILSKMPLHPIYIPERFGAFTIIIMGQTIASAVFGLESAHWHFSSVITSIMAFILAILIWGQYYRFTQLADYKCTLSSGQPYIYAHIPLIISLVIIGVCIQDLIKTITGHHDNVYIILCFAAILWLISFYALQYTALVKFKAQGITCLGNIAALLLLFFFHPLPPVFTISGLVIIFMISFGTQHWARRLT